VVKNFVDLINFISILILYQVIHNTTPVKRLTPWPVRWGVLLTPKTVYMYIILYNLIASKGELEYYSINLQVNRKRNKNMKPRRTLRKETSKGTVTMNTRFDENVHQFLRDQAFVQKKSMNLIIEECILRYKKMLTSSDDMVL
jgi:hypothetical protein